MNTFNLNTLKGRIAEQIIQDLFQQSGYNVFNFGLERLHPGLSKLIKNDKKQFSKSLRYMPDFVVQSSINGELFYLEVKFRANGKFSFDERYENYPYHNAWFIIVSPDKIQAIHYNLLIENKEINPEYNSSLLKINSFHINADLLAEYEEYAKVIFKSFKKEK
ncbi:MAG: hypothetical protein WAU21_07185 [Chitinophagales bacterium]|nr:hypothetical protein [Bacteroidota bacterium]MBK8487892.1 hypothetical protein [Bacteroidota bacterium]MBK8682354.1 hypothetical protein [Bacteroidota bacterium]MBP9188200.1 hypothetical protein [Chitinophagales bacterium]MBP9704426.1 hypothetical protein [Chitinophagales bacterium]